MIGKSVAVAYDARLYQALKGKYGEEVSLCLETLDPVFVLKAFGNFFVITNCTNCPSAFPCS